MKSVYESHGGSMAPRIGMAIGGALLVALAWWLLECGQPSGDTARRLFLAIGVTIYYIRILFTEFVFLKRDVQWSEALTIVPWLAFIVLMLAMEGGANTAPFGVAAIAGAVLFAAGSWINSASEFARHMWKRQPENRGRLYTGGWFRYSRHPNYLGDELSFTGLCLIAGAWITAVIPALMLAGFVFVNVPMLDRHLHRHYGAAFDDYARRTRKLIPFVY